MTNIARYAAADLPVLLDKISKNSIGMNEYLNRVFDLHETSTNYPPYNLVQLSNVESLLEIALAGFSKKEVNVYTQDGKLIIEGKKEDKETETTYLHKGLGSTVVYVPGRSVTTRKLDQFLLKISLSISLGRVVPQHHQRKDWF